MLSKPADIPYCGVREEVILNAAPKMNPEALRAFVHMVSERYAIRIRKDVLRQPAPWTNDPILRDYRFTNVRREHDRESLWYIKNIATNPNLSYKNKLLNAVLFRCYNKSRTSEILGMPLDFDNLDRDDLRAKIQAHIEKEPNYVWFTGAFITGGLKRAAGSDVLVKVKNSIIDEGATIPCHMSAWLVKTPFPEAFYLTEGEAKKWIEAHPDYEMVEAKEMDMRMRMINLVDKMHKAGFLEDVANAKNQKEVFDAITVYKGLADFLAYQIFVDFTYIPEFRFSENEFTVAGPGCKNGINDLFIDRDGMTHEEAIFWVRNNISRVAFKELGMQFEASEAFADLEPHDRFWNVMSLENLACEFSKYWRVLNGGARPRVKYRESLEPLPGQTKEPPEGFWEKFTA